MSARKRDVASSGFGADHFAQVLAGHFGGAAAIETSTSIVDAGDVAVHVACVDDVGSLLDDLAIVFLNAMPFDEPGDFHQQLFVSKRKIQIVVSTGMQAFDAGIV